MQRHLPLVIGHRGFAARFPDNSLAGVKAALAAGADGVEIDVRLSADGTWVCHHDRTRAGDAVDRLSTAALAREGVPTLAEVVAAVPPERWLYVEVKPIAGRALAGGMGALVALLRPRGDRTRLLSSSLPVLAACGEALPGVACSWVFGEMPEWLPNEVELSPRHTLVERLLWVGRPLHPWTVDRAGRMAALAAGGVASITTNRPDLALEVLHG